MKKIFRLLVVHNSFHDACLTDNAVGLKFVSPHKKKKKNGFRIWK